MKKIYLFLTILIVGHFSYAQKKKFTLEQIWASGEFSPKSVSGFQPMKDGETYCKLDFDSILKQFELNQYFYRKMEKRKVWYVKIAI